MRSLKEFINYAEKIERDFSHISLYLFLRLFGPRFTQKYFTFSPIVRRTKARILWLHKQIVARFGQEAADSFVFDYLTAKPRALDYAITLVATGAHYPSTDALSASITAISATAKRNTDRSIALVSALLERGDIELALGVVAEFKDNAHPVSFVDWNSLVHSLAPRYLFETSPAKSWSPDNMLPGQCKSRLILMDEKLSPAAIKSLATGAERVTLLQYGDLYGRIDLETVQAVLPGIEIAVEHGRSRIDRFQQQYFDIHRKTLEAAEALSKSFIENSPWLEQFVPGIRDFDKDLTLELSDKLFFKALRIEAVYQAVIDPAFDSVVVSFGESFELYRFFFSDPILWQSSRIKGCCRTQKIKTATKFSSRIAEMQRRATVGSRDPILGEIAAKEDLIEINADLEPSAKVKEYLESAAKSNGKTTRSDLKARKNIAFVAHDSRAYMGTSVQIATHLNERFDVDILATQGNPANLQKAIRSAQKDPYLSGPQEGRSLGLIKVSAKVPSKVIAKEFSDVFLPAVADATRRLFLSHNGDLSFRTTLDCMLTEGLPETVLHVMGNARAIATHLVDQNYSAIAISPIRSPRNAQFATIARAVGIPSIAIEPHCLTAAYCRYGTVLSDYAAVYSDYFAEEYDRHFGIPHGRCYTFGSPRIMRPTDYSPLDSRKEARKKIGLHEGDPPIIAFATQPMPAEHILAVWRMIIRAAKALDMPVRVILKRHPEEGPGHIERYRQIIADENAGNLCYVADVDIKDLLIASEVVLTCYSTTAIEAAILERNVAIVSLDGIEYPMPWHEVLGVPFCTDSGKISELVSDVLLAGPTGTTWVTNFKEANPELFDNSTFSRLAAIVDDVVAKGPQGIRTSDELPSTLFVTAPFREYLV
ncbi:CDP-glycerol glycerophosphotransferase family protein [Pararhizobium sp.]|uniref:CDP-glycerol glycerophosphotransferase family protein n=1 Tax=Pararhizobium sp. TaxID=1977563 RepID=UPI003D0D23A7